MIPGNDITDRLVDLLRKIPELVADMDGDPSRIVAYKDNYPAASSLTKAIYEMKVPSILATWQATTPADFEEMTKWSHQVTLFIRCRDYAQIFRHIVRGTPVPGDLPLISFTVHEACYPMDVPSIQRQRDEEGLDYFEMPIVFKEIFDE